MLFNWGNLPAIKEACSEKREITFEAPKEITAFKNDAAPQEWTKISPTYQLSYAQIFFYGGSDAREELMRLELLVHLAGGIISYKADGNDKVALKITWP